MQSPNPFAYPTEPHARKHGPCGYADYDSYRPWLRDEFSFRCVFCLHREQWGITQGTWDIDHFVPQSQDPTQVLNYENLLYVCRTCNCIKSDRLLPNPTILVLSKCLKVQADGTIVALNEEGELITAILRLDSDDRIRFRRTMIETIQSLADHNTATLIRWMCYPQNLPDLSKLKPPGGNKRTEGIIESSHARRSRGELPETY